MINQSHSLNCWVPRTERLTQAGLFFKKPCWDLVQTALWHGFGLVLSRALGAPGVHVYCCPFQEQLIVATDGSPASKAGLADLDADAT